MKKLSAIKSRALKGKTAILRVDLNIKTNKDPFKLEVILPTIKFLVKAGARVVLISHRGRPGKGLSARRLLSLRPFIRPISEALKEPVAFVKNIPPSLPKKGKIFLLENLRFQAGEDQNSVNLAKKIAGLGDFYVNDAFAVSHRQTASTVAITRLLPSYAGLLMEKELKHLGSVLKHPRSPLIAIFGGAKLKDKTAVIKNLLPKSTAVLLGSGAVKTKLSIRSSKIIAPVDWLAEKETPLDIGPITAKLYLDQIKKAKMIIWNGPLGKFEDRRFAGGSIAIAKSIAKSRAFSIVGGGETTQFIKHLKLEKKINFLSTGGGAMLEFLAGKSMPGIEALK